VSVADTIYTGFTQVGLGARITTEVAFINSADLYGAVAAGAPVLFTEPFNTINAGANVFYPAAPDSQYNYWTSSDSDHRYLNWKNDDQAFSHYTKASWDYADAYLVRSLYDSQELGRGDTFTDAFLDAAVSFQVAPSANTDLIGHRVRLVDVSTNGYMASLRYNGDVYLYRLDGGVQTQIHSDTDGVAGTETGARSMIFSVYDGTVSLKDSLASEAVSVADSTYTTFTQVGIGGRIALETVFIDNVDAYGTLVPAPRGTVCIIR
jgi:hypothetical protein